MGLERKKKKKKVKSDEFRLHLDASAQHGRQMPLDKWGHIVTDATVEAGYCESRTF